MAALYLAADVMLVTALRDGMNLVAKEYVAARFDDDGVLVLSEFTGASDELRAALLINPHDIDGVKDAILRAVEMPRAERRKRMRVAAQAGARERRRALVASRSCDAARGAPRGRGWYDGSDPLGELEWTVERGRRARRDHADCLPARWSERCASSPACGGCSSRSTSTAPSRPRSTHPEQARALPEARDAVLRLLALPHTRVALVSGRSLRSLDRRSPTCPTPRCSSARTASRSGSTTPTTGSASTPPSSSRSRCCTRCSARSPTSIDQVWLEAKPAGFALHTRLATEHDSRVAHLVALSEAQAEIDDLTVRAGQERARVLGALDDQGRGGRAPAPLHRRRMPCSTPATTSPTRTPSRRCSADDVGRQERRPGATEAPTSGSPGPTRSRSCSRPLATFREGDVHEQ